MKNKAPGFKKTKIAGGVGETVRTIIYAVAIAILIRSFAYEPFNIPSASMVPTLLIGDYIFVSKFSYGFSRYSLPFGLPLFPGRIFSRTPQRGDVVVFKLPRDNSTDYIKRLIGLPGDTIQMKDDRLYINDVMVKREFSNFSDHCEDPEDPTDQLRQHYVETLPNGVRHCIMENSERPNLENTEPFVVPPDHYFMMGDNRDNSSDSRDPNGGVGYVPAANLVGHAQFIFFSTDGSAEWWQFWQWPFAVRYGRLFKAIRFASAQAP
jgi:signal peptidase I